MECKYCKVEFIPRTKKQFTCGCKECKRQRNADHNKLLRQHEGYKTKFKNVMAKWRTENKAKAYLSNIKGRDTNTDLDLEWIQSKIDKGVCEVTGIPFQFPIHGEHKRGFNHLPWNLSIDRIDPNKGYTKDNCRAVVWAYNRAKGIWTDDTILTLARGIIDGHLN
jgi:hypothetical protein